LLAVPRVAVSAARTAPRPDHRPGFHEEFVHPVPKRESHEAGVDAGAHPADERVEDAGAGAPGDVEPWHRIAVPECRVAAALRPAHDGEESHAPRVQPRAFLTRGKVEIGLGPLARPRVVVPVETGGGEPVLPGKLDPVFHTHPALLGRVDQEEPAEGPPGLAAQARFGLLLENRHAPAGVDQLGRGDETGQAGTDDDHIGLLGHPETPSSWPGRARAAPCS
jgi:hypothetical protein